MFHGESNASPSKSLQKVLRVVFGMSFVGLGIFEMPTNVSPTASESTA